MWPRPVVPVGSPRPEVHHLARAKMPKEIVECVLHRAAGQPWGFSLAGGRDKGLSLKVGSVQEDSPAERAGLRTKDFLWRVGPREVLADDQATVASLIRASATELRISVERGDHIVPSFQELWGTGGTSEPGVRGSRALSGAAYYREAMLDHGLGRNIPTAFTTIGGRPWVENIQYNSPIEVYNKDTIVEMVKVMDSGVAVASLATPAATGAPPKVVLATDREEQEPTRSNCGWTVNASNSRSNNI